MNWPGFSAAMNAWWLLLLVPLIIFYFLKLRRPRVEVSSLALWQLVLNDQRVNSPFQKFRRNILLWLQVALLTLLVLAAMLPFIPAGAEEAEYLPVVIDCSASMAATDQTTGRSRLDLAKDRIRELIDNLLPGQKLSLIAMHSTAQRLSEFTDNQRVLRGALDQLTVRDVPGQLEDALRMTQALARTVPVSSVVIYSDGNLPAQVDFELPFKLNFQQLDPAGPNAGITAFNARQAGPPNWEVFLRVEVSAPVSGRVELLQDGKPVGSEVFALKKGESDRLTFTIEAERATQLEARLTIDSGNYDSLPADNIAWLDLPAARRLKVYADPDLRSFRHALRSIPGIEVSPDEGGRADRTAFYDLLMTEKPGDRDIGATVRMFAGVIPDDLKPLLTVQSTGTEFIDWDRSAALLQHMQLREIQLSDDIITKAGADDRAFEQLGYEVLAHGRNGPLILQKRDGADVSFHLLFHPDRSTLPYRVAFPVLVNNAVQVALHEASISESRGARTKVLPVVQLSSSTEYEVTGPGTKLTAKSNADGLLAGIPAMRVGRYEVRDGATVAATPAVSLLDSLETSLERVERIQFSELTVNASDSLLDTSRPLWGVLALLAFFLLLLEWWFFLRPPATTDAAR